MAQVSQFWGGATIGDAGPYSLGYNIDAVYRIINNDTII